MYEKLEQCPICKSGKFQNFIICKDFSVSQESFAIVICKKCQLKFTNPRPTEDNLSKYYQSEDYVSHTNKSNNLINTTYKVARHFTIKNKLKFIKKFHSDGNLLDYGCGTGNFIQQAKSDGWNVLGIEPSLEAQDHIAKNIKPKVYTTIKEIKLKNYFNIITLWHVLEHVYDLSKTVKKLKKLLHPEGKMIIAVPNSNSFDAQHYKASWAAYDVPRHLYHFSPTSMQALLNTHNLKLYGRYPMPLDAYYVSMLSEKYATGKNNYYKAMKMGHKSNQWAKENDENYSSIIYVAGLA